MKQAMKKAAQHHQRQTNSQQYLKFGLAGILVLIVVGFLYASLGQDIVGFAGETLGECTDIEEGTYFLSNQNERGTYSTLSVCSGRQLLRCYNGRCPPRTSASQYPQPSSGYPSAPSGSSIPSGTSSPSYPSSSYPSDYPSGETSGAYPRASASSSGTAPTSGSSSPSYPSPYPSSTPSGASTPQQQTYTSVTITLQRSPSSSNTFMELSRRSCTLILLPDSCTLPGEASWDKVSIASGDFTYKVTATTSSATVVEKIEARNVGDAQQSPRVFSCNGQQSCTAEFTASDLGVSESSQGAFKFRAYVKKP